MYLPQYEAQDCSTKDHVFQNVNINLKKKEKSSKYYLLVEDINNKYSLYCNVCQ